MENYKSKGTMNDYTINIDNMVYQKIMHWVNKATGEVSGLGKLTIDKTTGIITIKSAILLKQENTGTTTDIDAQAIGKAMFELRNEEGHLNFWWHSHVNMDVFWSGTDLDTIREIGGQGFVVATVFNKKREMLSCLYRKPDEIFPETFINGITTNIVDHISPELITEWDTDFNEKCKVKQVTYPDLPRTYDFTGEYGSEGYGRDWYSGWTTNVNKRQEQFDFDDNGIPMANEDAKIYSIKPELETIKDVMLEQTQYGKARGLLNKIMQKINNLKLQDPTKSYNLKKPYLDTFNTQFKNLKDMTK
jgi:hypothetical protein